MRPKERLVVETIEQAKNWKPKPTAAELRESVGERQIFSPEEMAGYLGISRTYAYTLLRTGVIPAAKVGRLTRIRKQDIDAYIERALENR
jgi:excisionase family DNA binding protein